MRSREQRIDDVRALLRCARGVRDLRASYRDALVATTGLSSAGVDLALDEHLEVDASDAEICALVDGAGDAPQIAVLLSANVFVASLRAISIARAASERVIVRPSSREPVFARALASAAGIELREGLDVASFESGEIHVYGRDETLASIRASARAGVRVRGHGAGMGVAVISASANRPVAAEALARDVIVFDQRGCLSPRLVFVLGDAEAFAQALHASLDAWAERVPRGRLFEAEDARRWLDASAFAGRMWRGRDHAVALGAEPALPPPGRHVQVVGVAGEGALAAKLEPLRRWVVAVGSDDLELAKRAAPTHARISGVGGMQKPPLDGPVDRR